MCHLQGECSVLPFRVFTVGNKRDPQWKYVRSTLPVSSILMVIGGIGNADCEFLKVMHCTLPSLAQHLADPWSLDTESVEIIPPSSCGHILS